ncbi:MAG: hypothetical protein K8T10_17925 [Candidatus Eremiobacteraeota bacterium]|nr:hypothetical protein [Candidatus Eremiobacteraeota bacterium]
MKCRKKSRAIVRQAIKVRNRDEQKRKFNRKLHEKMKSEDEKARKSELVTVLL